MPDLISDSSCYVCLSDMCQNIVTNKKAGLYDGAYKVVELAMGLKNKQK